MNEFYMEFDQRLERDSGFYISPFPRINMQGEVNYIIGQMNGKENRIATHTLFFPDIESIDRVCDGLYDSIKDEVVPFYGSFNSDLKGGTYNKDKLAEIFRVADFQVSLTYGKYPKELTMGKLQHINKYAKKEYGFDGVNPDSFKDVVKSYHAILKEIDKKL